MKMPIWRYLSLLLLTTGQLLLSNSGNAETTDKHFLWKVTTEDNRSAYLLGSVHFGHAGLYPLAPVIDQAFAESDLLAVEINILDTDPAEAANLMLTKGMYPDLENNLRAHISEETWQLLNETAPKYGLPIEFLQQQKPWLVSLTLSAIVFQQAGYKEDLGIDYHFLQQARQHNKPIVDLESFNMQINLFEQFSEQEQEAFLRQTLQELKKGTDYLEQLFESWKTGDADTLNRLVNDAMKQNPETLRIYQVLLVDRNITMADKIENLMQTGQTPFICVGAGHMVGPDGLVELLRDKGYQVRQM